MTVAQIEDRIEQVKQQLTLRRHEAVSRKGARYSLHMGRSYLRERTAQ